MAEQTPRGIEQGRATFAYEQVKDIAGQSNDDLKKKYKSAAKKLPVLIKTNGLAQTLAFIQKRDPGNDKLFEQIDAWLRQKQLAGADPKVELVKIVISTSSNEYRRLTTETIALLNWIRRFVDGLMADVKGDQG